MAYLCAEGGHRTSSADTAPKSGGLERLLRLTIEDPDDDPF
ncbi:MAG: hypothetical protein AB8A34_02440 [Prochlorococcus sp.]